MAPAPAPAAAAAASSAPQRSCLKCQPIRLSGCDGFHTTQTLRRVYVGPSPVASARANAAARQLAADQLQLSTGRPDDASEAAATAAAAAHSPDEPPDRDRRDTAAAATTDREGPEPGQTDATGGRRGHEADQGADIRRLDQDGRGPPDAVQFRWRDSFRPTSAASDSLPPALRIDHESVDPHSLVPASAPAGVAAFANKARPRPPIRDPSNVSVASNVSFASAHSLPRSVFSEADAADRAPSDARAGSAASNASSRDGSGSSSPLRALLSPRSPGKRDRRLFRREHSAAGNLGIDWKSPSSIGQARPASRGSESGIATARGVHAATLEVPAAAESRSIRRVASAGSIHSDRGQAASGPDHERLGTPADAAARPDRLRSASAEDRARVRLEGSGLGLRAGHHMWESSNGQSKPLPLLDLPVREADESAASSQDEAPPAFASSSAVHTEPRDLDIPATATSIDAAHLTPGGAPSTARRLSFEDPNRSLTSSMRSSLQPSADERIDKGKRRALTPSLFARSPSKSSVSAHELDGSDETILDRFKPRTSLSTHFLDVDRGQRPPTRGSWNSGSPQSTLQRASGARLALHGLSGQPDVSFEGDAAARSAPETVDASVDVASHDGTGDGPDAVRTAQRGVGLGLPSSAGAATAARLGFPGSGSNSKATATRRLPMHASGVHARDYSRQSRMSRASTVGTFNTMGTNATEGSFGVAGSIRDRFSKTFFASNSLRRPKPTRGGSTRRSRGTLGRARTDSVDTDLAPLRSRSFSGAVGQRGLERDPSFASTGRRRTRNLSADSMFSSSHGGRHSKASSLGGVPAGAVGTSGGGTKWIGGSFEIGGRLLDILEERRAKIVEREPCRHGATSAAATAGSTSEPLAGTTSATKEGRSPPRSAEEKAIDPADDPGPGKAKDRSRSRSPSAVISLMAAEARDATQERARSDAKEEKRVEEARKAPSQPPNGHSRRDTSEGSDLAAAKERQASGASSDSAADRLLAVRRPRDELRASIISISQDRSGPEDSFDIESRQGWKDIASALTAPLSSMARSGSQRAEAADAASDATTAPARPQRRDLQPPLVRQRSSSLRTADSASEAASRFTDALSYSEEDGTSHRMTRAEAMTHPDPPIEADDRFPELTHALLRRPSDDVVPRRRAASDAASDHAVVARPVASPESMSLATRPAPELVAATAPTAATSTFSGLKSVSPILDGDGRPASIQTPSLVQAVSNKSSSPGSTRALLAPQRTSSQRPWSATAHSPLAEPRSPQAGDIGADPHPARETSRPRKLVTFDQKPPLMRGLTASLFAAKAQDDSALELGALDRPRIGSGDAVPVPPEEVLARPNPPTTPSPSSELQLGGRPAKVDFTLPTDSSDEVITRKSVLKKDRMLVKLAWTAHEDLPKDFDEMAARKYAVRDEEWREYVVVFRMGKLELWGDATLAGKAVGHGDRLKLRHTISLSRGTTFMSVYSPIDRIFCLTHQPWKASLSHQHRNRLHLRRHGTDIALFDCRAQTVALDWMWELWRELGGTIPTSIDVNLASMGAKVRIAIPEEVTAEHLTRREALALESSRGKVGAAAKSRHPLQIGEEGFKAVDRQSVVSMLRGLADSLPDWKEMLDHGERHGMRLELAWRRGNVLDWIIHETTVDGQDRPWAILAGSILKEYRTPSILELRAGSHYPTNVRLATGKIMDEPPAVEGFVWRVKPVSSYLTRLYITTHDGHMFICKPSRACPPDRLLYSQLQHNLDRMANRTSATAAAAAAAARAQPRRSQTTAAPTTHKSAAYRALARFLGREKAVRREESIAALRQQVVDALSWPAESVEELQAQIEAYRAFEKRRQFEQICNSDGYVDLRSIWMIRAVGKGPVRCPGDDDTKPSGPRGGAAALRRVQADREAAPRENEESDREDGDAGDGDDDDDIGGEEGIAAAADRTQLRQSRQIEIVLANGRTIRIEAYSKSVAREWIERIAELVKYWRRREKADALDVMSASGFDMGAINRKLQGRELVDNQGVAISEEKLAPILSNIWHWCAIEGCRGIIKCGRLFHKRSSYAPFQSRYYLLIAGRLLSFKLVKSQRTARSRQNAGIFHRRQERVIHLRDAYVFSGKLSEDMLSNGRSEPAQAIGGVGGGGSNSGNRHRIPRVYADGLYSFDEDEDCTLVVRYRPERVNTPVDPPAPDFAKVVGHSGAGGVGGAQAASASAPTAAAPTGPPHPADTDRQSSNTAAAAGGAAKASIPKLEDKTHRYIALRARNKLERDQWVRCIAHAIEQIVRDDREREERMKSTGKVDF